MTWFNKIKVFSKAQKVLTTPLFVKRNCLIIILLCSCLIGAGDLVWYSPHTYVHIKAYYLESRNIMTTIVNYQKLNIHSSHKSMSSVCGALTFTQ